MKIAFIVPKYDDQHSPQFQPNSKVFPPVALARMAGIAGNSAKIVVIDERITPDHATHSANIAIIFINSYNQQRALHIASHYRAMGCCVVLTGPILSNVSEKYHHHADCLFIGAGENYLTEFLADFCAGNTRFFYRSHNTDMSNVKNRHDSKNYRESENISLQLAS